MNIPVERQQRPLFAAAPIEPDVQDNVTGHDGRIYVLVLDDLHTQRRCARRAPRRRPASSSSATSAPTTRPAVVFTSGRSDAAQEFTNSQRRLLAAVDKFTGRKLRSSTLERLDEEARTPRHPPAGRPHRRHARPRAMDCTARTTLDSIAQPRRLTWAASAGRRKAIVYFSEGIDYDINDVFNNRSASTVMDATRDAVAAATRANVAIYGIDARGLGAGADDLIEVADLPQRHLARTWAPRAFNNEARLGAGQPARALGGDRRLRRGQPERPGRRTSSASWPTTAPTTCSATTRPTSGATAASARSRSGCRAPGLTVRARKGYVAARGRAEAEKDDGKTAPELRAALISPLPMSGLPLAHGGGRVQGRPTRRARSCISTLIARPRPAAHRKGRHVPQRSRSGGYGVRLRAASPIPGDRATLALNLKPDSVTRLRAGGFRILNQIDLPPGRYQLRAAAREGNTKPCRVGGLRPRRARLLEGAACRSAAWR